MDSFVKVDMKGVVASDLYEVLEDNLDITDFYDSIDVPAWDFPTSPLHLAIVSGNFDMIHYLITDRGANVSLPVKLMDFNRKPKTAILSLVLALSLPEEQAKTITLLLLSLGATLAQADLSYMTAVHYAAIEQPDVLDILLEHDRPTAERILNHVWISTYNNTETILTMAIKRKDHNLVKKLLSLGAKPIINDEEYIQAYRLKHNHTTM